MAVLAAEMPAGRMRVEQLREKRAIQNFNHKLQKPLVIKCLLLETPPEWRWEEMVYEMVQMSPMKLWTAGPLKAWEE